jgi:superoxide dismutase
MEVPFKPLSINFVPAVFTKEQFDLVYKKYVSVVEEARAAAYDDLMKKELSDQLLQKYNHYFLFSLFLSLLSDKKEEASGNVAEFLLKNIDSITTEYQRGTRWITIIAKKTDFQPRMFRQADSRFGMIFSVPILAISIEEEIWRPQYSSVEEYWNNVLHSINWQKVDERVRILSAIAPIVRLVGFYE